MFQNIAKKTRKSPTVFLRIQGCCQTKEEIRLAFPYHPSQHLAVYQKDIPSINMDSNRFLLQFQPCCILWR